MKYRKLYLNFEVNLLEGGTVGAGWLVDFADKWDVAVVGGDTPFKEDTGRES